MELIRLGKKDLEDLRNLLFYLKENGMQIEDLNQMIYHLSKKYKFDPFKYEINLLTGIISERKNQHNPYEQIRIEKQARLEQTKEITKKPIIKQPEITKKPKIQGEKIECVETIEEGGDRGRGNVENRFWSKAELHPRSKES